MENFKRKFYTWITGHQKLVVSVFLILMIICAIMWRSVGVNYDIKDYLPQDSSSTVSIEVMGEEYEEGVPNARVMIKDVSIPEALEYKEKIAAVEGVDAVNWLDDSVSTAVPLETVDEDLKEQYYKDGNALFQVTIDKDHILTAVPDVREAAGDDAALTGDAVSTEVATTSTVEELPMLCVLAVAVVLLILVFATESWIEPLLVLISLGIAILINAGTNLIFGTVSFVTNGAGNVLLLAVSLDYSVFLLHRFHEYREELGDPRQAMIEALCRSTSSIMSSGLTTVIGFLALVLMRFLLGPDLGLASAKGVAISLITAFVFLPAWILLTYKAVEKTRHRPLMPDFTKLGKLVVKTMIPMVCIFVLIMIPAFLASNSNEYYYGASKIFGSETRIGQDTDEILEVFGEGDSYALLVPKGNLAYEKALSEDLQQLDGVSGIVSYVDTVGAEIPVEYLSEDIVSQLNSDDYTRMVINAEVPQEGDQTYKLVREIRAAAQEYYPDQYYLAGGGPSYYDLMKVVSADMLKVNLVAIAAVYLILALMMRSVLLPVLLVASIETAIWINVAVPYFTGTTVFYISYLIISAIQLGATVDYAILMTDRYRECRQTLNKKEAVVETVASSVPSILVSGLALTTVGFLLGNISSHGILAMLGIFLGRGALLSLFIVVFVLPGLLYLFDKLYINRGKGKMNKKKITAAVTAFLLLGAAFTPAVSQAATAGAKEEVIYGNLTTDGSVSKTYAVNIFEEEDITDYGSYTEIKNLTSTDEITAKGDKVEVKASQTPFYYEGTLEDAQLPWIIDIDYTLDGKSCDAADLAGKNGKLGIDLSVTKNFNCDSFFYENYALQIAITLDGNYCRNIKADGATIANVGSSKQLTYTVLPGKGSDISVTADVTAFEMDEITINGIKLNLDVDVDDSELQDAAKELQDGTEKLDEGAGSLDQGAGALQDGAKDLNKGAEALGTGTDTLKEGTATLKEGAAGLSAGAAQVYAGTKTLAEQVNGAAYKTVLNANGVDIDTLLQGNQQAVKKMNIMVQSGMLDASQKELCQQMIQLLQGSSAAINGAVTYLDGVNEQLTALRDGAESVSTGAATLAEGAADLDEGAASLQEGTETLQEGTSALESGTSELKSGTEELKEGTSQFVSETSGIDETITEKIDSLTSEITGSDEVHSFLSDKNTNVESVQFVLKTEAIQMEEEEVQVVVPEEKGFFQKLIDLFR